jgi:hypothetical protein
MAREGDYLLLLIWESNSVSSFCSVDMEQNIRRGFDD